MAWQIKQSKKDCLWQYSYIIQIAGSVFYIVNKVHPGQLAAYR
jgi:hypothetical protein